MSAQRTFGAQTTYHVRRARSGDAGSIDWLVRRLTPVLMTQARYRLRRLRSTLRRSYDPADVVQETWVRFLPHLRDERIEPRNGRWTPVVVSYLSKILLHFVLEIAKKDRRDTPHDFEASPLPAETTHAIGRVCRAEARDAVQEALEQLAERDRELFVLRAVEELPYGEISQIVGREETALRMQFKRLRDRLRRLVPDSLFDELGE